MVSWTNPLPSHLQNFPGKKHFLTQGISSESTVWTLRWNLKICGLVRCFFLLLQGGIFWFLVSFRRCKCPDFGALKKKHRKLPILGSSLTSSSLEGLHSIQKGWGHDHIWNYYSEEQPTKNQGLEKHCQALCLRKKGQTFHVPFKECLYQWSFTTIHVFVSSLPSWTSLKPYLLAVVPTACGHVLLQALAPVRSLF